jgi:rhamnosyltransferase subunit B
MSRRIVLATFGSLGDLHPYIAIARRLADAGDRPLIASFDIYRDAVIANGIEFATMRPSPDLLGDRAALMKRLFDPRQGPEFMVRELFMPHIRDSYADLDAAAAGADLLVTHPITFAAPLVAEKRGLPWVSSVLAPMSMFSAIDPPLIGPAPWLRSVRSLGIGPYKAIFALARMLARHWEKPLALLRADLGLAPARHPAQFEGQYSPLLNLGLFPRWLAEPRTDWPANTVLCGFPRYDGMTLSPEVQSRLDDFCDAGSAPIVFGLGSSAVLVAGDFWKHAMEATQRLGRRAILLTGIPSGALGPLPSNVAEFEYLPYSAVFPRAAAVVHQAGIGTLAQAFAAGRPQLITPVAFDQPDNAERAVRLGVARAIPFHRVTGAALATELDTLLADESYEAAATRIGKTSSGDDGAIHARDALCALLGRLTR